MGMVSKKCEECGSPMQVRLADVARGWGKFCSKSCKAVRQAKAGASRKRKYPRHAGVSKMAHRFCGKCGDNAVNGVHTHFGIDWFCEVHLHEFTMHPFDNEALGQW